jgi:hypothetical protein
MQRDHALDLQGLEIMVGGSSPTAPDADGAAGTAAGARPGPPERERTRPAVLLGSGLHSAQRQRGVGADEHAAFARSVVGSFQAKLGSSGEEGNSGGGGGFVSVSQQVEDLVKEASDPGNLARMYEGWMPWV